MLIGSQHPDLKDPAFVASATIYEPLQRSSDSIIGGVDEFAQTRPPDDLFGDDLTPVEQQIGEDVTPATSKRPSAQRDHKSRGVRRGGSAATRPNPHITIDGDQLAQPSDDVIDQPRKDSSVRGDRSGTGGIKKAKLSEIELSERMAAVKMKNVTLEAAHARAEADKELSQVRETQAQERRKLERQNRQQMMGEREKNRLRKLDAAQGRDWDAEKYDEQRHHSGNGGREGHSRYRRGAHGGVVNGQSRDINGQLYENENRDQHLNIGERGGLHGRDGGRGPEQRRKSQTHEQSIPQHSEFPALGPAKRNSIVQDAQGALEAQPNMNLSIVTSTLRPDTQAFMPSNGTSWAEEMESTGVISSNA